MSTIHKRNFLLVPGSNTESGVSKLLMDQVEKIFLWSGTELPVALHIMSLPDVSISHIQLTLLIQLINILMSIYLLMFMSRH